MPSNEQLGTMRIHAAASLIRAILLCTCDVGGGTERWSLLRAIVLRRMNSHCRKETFGESAGFEGAGVEDKDVMRWF